ncbi:hypothetical protein KGA66_09705 [Actinocrinis puniceicyclus]|uniref:LppX_LprAFG lipoprotein n=1 Tax=Actinocrinis puniceicyclus TaxID=977794 RepID=A0A8J7WM44_9ACTN|nr:hypothetical protein [Actinocrinis puniceicyclus]MBS2963320.1 hypothetical protein [Actinocrinis puniceicyclus]
MSRWSGSARVHDRRRCLPRRRPAGPALAVVVVALGTAGALGGCSSSPRATAGESATTQLAQAAGGLDAAKTFKLTVDTRVPKSTGVPVTASPLPGPSPEPQTETIKMSGTWDVTTGLARMDGTVNSVKTTILSASGVEYVSLTAGTARSAGKKWLKVDDSDATFGDFCNPHLVAQLLRAYHEVHLVSAGHLSGTIDSSEADQHIADPNLVASLSGLPATLHFDVWTDGSGAPTKIEFALAGTGPVTTGSVRLDAFGTEAAQVSVPTINEVEQAPVG